MTPQEESVINKILDGCEIIKEAVVESHKLPETDISNLIKVYLYKLGSLTMGLGYSLVILEQMNIDSNKSESFEEMMKRLMKKDNNEDRDKTE